MSLPTGLSLVVPLYRDATTVEALVDDAITSLERVGVPYEILLVDDGSPDESGSRARALAERTPAVRAIAHERNQGLGAAISTGVLAARHSHVLYTDGDHAYRLADVARFVEGLAGADLVIGIRDPSARPWTRRVLTVLWGVSMRVAFRLTVADVNCSFKLFPRAAFGHTPLVATQGFADAEILLRARERGMRVAQLPVSLRREASRPSNFLNRRILVATAAEAFRAWSSGLFARAHQPAVPTAR